MTTLLAIDTATEALSIAIQRGGELETFHERLPRMHQQRIFEALHVLFGGIPAAKQGLDAIVYGKGPGSFTGLRIAASAAQGLAYSLDIPVIGVSTLATQAKTFIRHELINGPCVLVSTIDARIGQTYVQCFDFDGSDLVEGTPATIRTAEDTSNVLATSRDCPIFAIGDGVPLIDKKALDACGNVSVHTEVLPEAQDMIAPAAMLLQQGQTSVAAEAYPDYVQQEIGWKKLSEQGRSS